MLGFIQYTEIHTQTGQVLPWMHIFCFSNQSPLGGKGFVPVVSQHFHFEKFERFMTSLHISWLSSFITTAGKSFEQ